VASDSVLCYKKWPMNAVTRLLTLIENGESRATDELFVIVYDELRRLAAAKLAQETPGQTLQTTALVHEAYLRLMRGSAEDSEEASGQWQSRAHFFAAAAEAMRRILIEGARRKGRIKRGGDRNRIDAELVEPAVEPPSEDLLALDEALAKLEKLDPVKANVVKLRYFAGLSIEDTASALQLSAATVKRYWLYARAWLKREIGKGN
jgi:RNA polymerase sigma factor (TIGR02999 family)